MFILKNKEYAAFLKQRAGGTSVFANTDPHTGGRLLKPFCDSG